ncbi:hypothetical protein BMJ32_15895 [Sinorhizobium medicae]|uniref:Uncharacterized protein n=1 Tax=Sinorhizobium medicae TaxID=110321 RepID=A0ABX4TJK5_9HYPH|nr:hypothetical protein BMJ35_31350 [Sinorhizobium medicae]PLU00784.1 hypothetical protein BMJ32_15895 [Sinorhizobium medicae]PLU01509.1 hypothetical protein BMJ33_19140 [Sinorhizobium medicae]PLU02395.1 hypothetical protein BMJ34_10450 [Sinorhizobium medicae]PLU11812.1 hypothetical protein BMJ30_28730 [Sinorhizobium medicae]
MKSASTWRSSKFALTTLGCDVLPDLQSDIVFAGETAHILAVRSSNYDRGVLSAAGDQGRNAIQL